MDICMDEEVYYETCVERCMGSCCDPWWGIIFYTLKKNALGEAEAFERELAAGIRKRVDRIKTSYVTKESPSRALFSDPDKYNVTAEKITVTPAGSLDIHVRAMFAFRCLFLSPEKQCEIHPTAFGGRDIRPPHCAELGAPDARPGEKGYCRIIRELVDHAGDTSTIEPAINFERRTSEKHFSEGVDTIDEAAEGLAREVRDYCRREAPSLLALSAGGADAPGKAGGVLVSQSLGAHGDRDRADSGPRCTGRRDDAEVHAPRTGRLRRPSAPSGDRPATGLARARDVSLPR